MFDIGWTEMLVVGIVAIIFVGPKELPGMLRTFGRVIKKVRSLAGEFQGQFNEALKEAELDGLKDTVNDVRSLDPTKAIKDKLNPLKQDLEAPVEKSKAEEKTRSTDEILAEIKEDYAKAQEKAKAAGSGPNAVPGFSSAPEPEAAADSPAKAPKPKKAPAKRAAKAKSTAKPTAKSSAAKKPATPKKAKAPSKDAAA